MRTGRTRIVVVARNLETGEKFICYEGTNLLEGKLTMRVFKQMDKEEGNEGLYFYSVLQKGTLGCDNSRIINGRC